MSTVEKPQAAVRHPAKPQAPRQTPVIVTGIDLSIGNMVELVLTFWLASFVICFVIGLLLGAVAGLGWLALMFLF